ncbi:hypothetical protein Q1695_011587 [Nippostrongylus brasiliensis]|nr:hypothetical protein Q1695_011587 [Nippostrongylus brasiliensis]
MLRQTFDNAIEKDIDKYVCEAADVTAQSFSKEFMPTMTYDHSAILTPAMELSNRSNEARTMSPYIVEKTTSVASEQSEDLPTMSDAFTCEAPETNRPELECSQGLTQEFYIHRERLKKFPVSYYHVEEMNKGPVDYAPRLAQVPSQYQLESLAEIYVCDYPQFFKSPKRYEAGEMDMMDDTTSTPLMSDSDCLRFSETQSPRPLPNDLSFAPVQSNYVSKMLY